MSYLVANPEGIFSHDEAQLIKEKAPQNDTKHAEASTPDGSTVIDDSTTTERDTRPALHMHKACCLLKCTGHHCFYLKESILIVFINEEHQWKYTWART